MVTVLISNKQQQKQFKKYNPAHLCHNVIVPFTNVIKQSYTSHKYRYRSWWTISPRVYSSQ